MTVYYVKNSCFDVPPEEYRRGNSAVEPAFESTPALPVTDAQAYIQADAPIPNDQTFVMSRMWEHSSVFALDFNNSRDANAVFGRMSYFVEVAKKTQIQPFDDDCRPGQCHKGEGYDLRLSDVSDFYNFALQNQIELSDAENAFLNYSVENGLFKREPNGTVTPMMAAALFATSRNYSISSRRAIFTHEYSHALYFADPSFRNIVHDHWQALKPEERRFLTGALIASGFYASGEDWLIETEAQAHGIANPVTDDGFVNILDYAYRNCQSLFGQPGRKACDDFYSYKGDIRSAVHSISYGFRRATECDVPFAAGWEIKDGFLTSEPFPERCTEAHEPHTEEDDIVLATKETTVLLSGTVPELRIDVPKLVESIYRLNVNAREVDQISNPRFSALLDEIQSAFDGRHGKK